MARPKGLTRSAPRVAALANGTTINCILRLSLALLVSTAAKFMAKLPKVKPAVETLFACRGGLLTQDKTHLNSIHAADLAIIQHIKIKGPADPYDQLYAIYFEQRRSRQWRRRMMDQSVLLTTALERI